MDCVEKYNGWRNFFKNSTGKCEVIHECYTKGKEGELPEIVSASFMQYCRGKAQSLNRAKKQKLKLKNIGKLFHRVRDSRQAHDHSPGLFNASWGGFKGDLKESVA